jgi:hypothetical protein
VMQRFAPPYLSFHCCSLHLTIIRLISENLDSVTIRCDTVKSNKYSYSLLRSVAQTFLDTAALTKLKEISLSQHGAHHFGCKNQALKIPRLETANVKTE